MVFYRPVKHTPSPDERLIKDFLGALDEAAERVGDVVDDTLAFINASQVRMCAMDAEAAEKIGPHT